MNSNKPKHSDKQFEYIDGVAVPKQRKVNIASPARTIAKTISWRIVGTLDTMILSWIITGSWRAGLAIGGAEIITKMTLYYFHERLWENVKWGKYWMKYGLIRRIKLNYIKYKRRKNK
jgi:uncharacterized membrane protein